MIYFGTQGLYESNGYLHRSCLVLLDEQSAIPRLVLLQDHLSTFNQLAIGLLFANFFSAPTASLYRFQVLTSGYSLIRYRIRLEINGSISFCVGASFDPFWDSVMPHSSGVPFYIDVSRFCPFQVTLNMRDFLHFPFFFNPRPLKPECNEVEDFSMWARYLSKFSSP